MLLTFISILYGLTSLALGAEQVLVEGDLDNSREQAFALTEIAIDENTPTASDLGDVINRAPGTQLRRFGGLGAYSAIGIRGSSLRQVQVFLDGVPLNPDGSTAINLAEWPLHAFSSVQIYRGNLPIQFAAAPIGGAINLISHVNPSAASARIGAGQYNTWRFNAMSWNQTKGKTDALFLANGFTTQGDFLYFDDRGTLFTRLDDRRTTRQNNQSRQISGLTRLRTEVGTTKLSLVASPMSRSEGLPGHTNTPALHTTLRTDRSLISARANSHINDYHSNTQLWHTLRHEEYDDRDGELGTGSNWSQQQSQALGLLHHSLVNLNAQLQLEGTLSARNDSYSSTNLLTGGSPSSPNRQSLGLSIAIPWWVLPETVYIYPAAQLQFLQANLDQQVHRQLSPHPRLAVAWYATSNLLLKTNFGHFFRPADYFELFGDRGSIIGNPNLKPERSWQGDLGAQVDLTKGNISTQCDVIGFLNNYRDQIVYVQNAQRTMVPVNLDQSRTAGLESSFRATVLDRWDLQASYTYTHSRNTGLDRAFAGNQLPHIPTSDISLLTSVFWNEHARLGTSWTFTGSTYFDATNWYASSPRQYLTIFARLGLPKRGLFLEFDWLNLTDTIAETRERNPINSQDSSQIVTAVTDFVGYPLPGRTWLLELQWRPKNE